MPEAKRQLAAIMFTDIVGYTAMMSKSEEKTLEIRRINKEIHQQKVEAAGGRWLKEMGDGTLASFPTITDAVKSAVEIRQTCKQELDIELKIGIHSGEIVFEEGDIFGDGVNVASRIQDLAVGGGILISEPVFNDIKNKGDFKASFIGETSLKNVDAPVKIFQVLDGDLEKPSIKIKKIGGRNKLLGVGAALLVLVLAAIFIYQQYIFEEPIHDNSIAVLPFVNMSPDQDNQYFADGVMDAILNHLGKIEAFRVISRTTMEKYRDHGKTMQEIGEELGVSYILEGSAQKYGQEIRITAQLIKAATDVHLWSNDYTRDFKEIFSLQSEIAQSITRELKIILKAEVKDQIESIPTTNIEAYNLYLKGSFELSGLTEEAFRLALKHFQLAIEKDPGFAAAYAGEALAYSSLGSWHTSLSKAEFIIKGRNSALKALELDENLADAYIVLAINKLFEWDWDGADQMFVKAMQLNPNIASSRNKYANFLTWMGRFEESIAISEQTVALDPLNPIAYNELANTLMIAGRNPEALTQYLIGLELDPDFRQSHLLIGMNYIKTGNFNKGVDHLEFLWDMLDELPSTVLGLMGWHFAKAGLHARARHLLDVLRQREKSGNRNDKAIATIYTGLGEYEEAIKFLDQAFQDKSREMITIKVSYMDDPLRSDPRFQTILKKMKLDQ